MSLGVIFTSMIIVFVLFVAFMIWAIYQISKVKGKKPNKNLSKAFRKRKI